MVLELHVWGPAFGLPSIDAECIATIAYFNRIVPHSEWILVSDYYTSISPRDEFPVLLDGVVRTTGFSSIVSYLRNHHSGAYDLDYNLSHQQQTDKTAFVTFLQSTASPLIDLSLYVSSENYHSITSSAYTAILPWYANYTIPPTRRDVARARTAHLGLSSLDVNIASEDGAGPGRGMASSEFEAAKRASGIPSAGQATQPKVLSMGRGKGIGGLLSSPIYAARFKLDALSNELLEPLSDLLGKKDYLFEGDKPSSLDCLAFGYLSLMFYPSMPQAWLKEALQTRHPRIVRYISRMRDELIGGQEVKPADVWSISYGSRNEAEIKTALRNLSMHLPWRPGPSRSLLFTAANTTREILSSLPILSNVLQRDTVIQTEATRTPNRVPSSLPSPFSVNVLFTVSAVFTAGLAGMAIHQRRFPRESELIFWALRPTIGFGEAGNMLSILADQLPRAAAARF